MSYTLAGIRNRILIDKLDDEDFEPDVVDNFINDAQKDIFSEYELPFTEKIFTGNLPASATMFQFPSDVSGLQSVIVADSNNNAYDITDNYIPFRDFNELYPAPGVNQAGAIQYWTIYGGKMIVSRPIPTDSYLTIYYNKVPAMLTEDTQVPELPEEFQELLLLGAFYRVQLREGDTDEGLLTKSEYQRKLEQMANRYGFRVNNGPIKMKNRQRGR